MVSEQLRRLMACDERIGVFDGADARSGSADHPVCGDQVQLSVRMVDGRIAEVRWLAAGCPATMAVAALCARVLVDVPVAQAPARLQQAILQHGGLAATERHAESMVLRALRAASGG